MLAARMLTIALAVAALALAACGKSDERGGPSTLPTAAAPLTLTGGATTLAIDPQTAGVFSDNGIEVTAAVPGRERGDALVLPIASGQIDATSLAGVIAHRGGVRFSSDRASVVLRALQIDTRTQQVTADAGRGRLAVFDLDQGNLAGTQAGRALRVSGAVALLTPNASHALNQALKVSVFTPKLIVGDLAVNALSAG